MQPIPPQVKDYPDRRCDSLAERQLQIKTFAPQLILKFREKARPAIIEMLKSLGVEETVCHKNAHQVVHHNFFLDFYLRYFHYSSDQTKNWQPATLNALRVIFAFLFVNTKYIRIIDKIRDEEDEFVSTVINSLEILMFEGQGVPPILHNAFKEDLVHALVEGDEAIGYLEETISLEQLVLTAETWGKFEQVLRLLYRIQEKLEQLSLENLEQANTELTKCLYQVRSLFSQLNHLKGSEAYHLISESKKYLREVYRLTRYVNCHDYLKESLPRAFNELLGET